MRYNNPIKKLYAFNIWKLSVVFIVLAISATTMGLKNISVNGAAFKEITMTISKVEQKDEPFFRSGIEIPGACICDEEGIPVFEDGREVGVLYNSQPLDEASGLAASRQNQHVLWTHEDDYNHFIFALKTDGTILGKYRVGTGGRDVEDIAIGPGPTPGIDYLYIGHIGDNDKQYPTISVRRVPEPIVNTEPWDGTTITVLNDVETITMRYPDGKKDAETLMVDTNGDILIISKRLNPNRVYLAAYPQSTTETIQLEHKATLPKGTGMDFITSGDISADGRWIIITNDRVNDYACIWYRAPETNVWDAFINSRTIIDIMDEYQDQPLQGEAICYDPQSCGFYTVSEHKDLASVPIMYYERLIIPENRPPVVENIPDQTINKGSNFTSILLDLFVSDDFDSDSEITWSSSCTGHLIVSISSGHIATISIPEEEWYGQETITFTATDTGGLSDSDSAIFTVLYIADDINNPPIISNPFPVHGAIDVSIDISILQIDIYDIDGDRLDWSITTIPDIGSASAITDINGTKSCRLNDLEYLTNYTWFVHVTDGVNWVNISFNFTTEDEHSAGGDNSLGGNPSIPPQIPHNNNQFS